MIDTPVTLIGQLRQSADPAAWERFVHLFAPLLSEWAVRLGVRSEDRPDFVQDLFAKLLRVLPEFPYDPQQSFRGWLWRLASNHRSDLRRRARRQVGTVSIAGDAEFAAGGEDAIEVAEAEYRRMLLQRTLQLAETQFSQRDWLAFRESLLGARPPAEVAHELGVSVNSVYLARSRILRFVRTTLDGFVAPLDPSSESCGEGI